MINGLSGNYVVDSIGGNYDIKDKYLYRDVKLQLLENGTYHFMPGLKILKGYEGQWDLSDDGEFSYFIFKCNNGKYQMRRDLTLDVESNGSDYTIYFGKQK
ncbi:hypothetical protein ACFFGT_25970 [Mucilaginibacter angelicae]|uniref:Uncharacterized protein n=1 Tax=Mucilaginibacter angelicae TaxID=869718 RepID=A0ABV6LDX8_9SPHI